MLGPTVDSQFEPNASATYLISVAPMCGTERWIRAIPIHSTARAELPEVASGKPISSMPCTAETLSRRSTW